ncbi:MAG: 16S rRNA (cytosine(1402)-N(4))-methyltransferase RsmH [Balneolaceae bacterium]|nr:MAG: 16S rRNA (cytosine(1402)-N(4))-methyltransferase RsmH [Balneolaceae bacterium]
MNLKTENERMDNYYPHTPVLLDSSVEFLVTDTSGVYIDATLGGAGHTTLILDRLDRNGTVFGVDQDREALAEAFKKVGEDSRFHSIEGNFGYLSTLIPPEFHGKINGVLLDLGVSTHQIREPERGFSFQHEGPLDMRMSELSGTSAYEVVNNYEYKRLRDLIYHYGEERLSRQIAREIINRRPLETTLELRSAIESVLYGPHIIKSVARVFQAIRIEVNQELEVLKMALDDSLSLLAPGGRIVVISYHSLEDRIIKNFFRSGNTDGELEKDFYGNPLTPIRVVTKHIITPSDEEISQNPAARSAKLRVGEKISEA